MKEKMKRAAVNMLLMACTVAAAVALGSRAPAWFKQWQGVATQGDFSLHAAGQPHQLTLYGTKTCKFCKQARIWLQANGIAYNDALVDESTDASKRYELLGVEGVPVLVSSGEFVVGFTEQNYGKFMKSNPQQLRH